MNKEYFQMDPALSFAECRYSTNSGRLYKPHMHKTFSIGAADRGKGEVLEKEQLLAELVEVVFKRVCDHGHKQRRWRNRKKQVSSIKRISSDS